MQAAHIVEIQHCIRVANLCKDWVESAGIKVNCMGLVAAAQVHDIGKLRVSPAILTKPSSPSPAEWEKIKRHPVWSHEWIIRHRGDKEIAAIALQHHEAPDGSGYPGGITCIKLEAAVLKICDIYDALTRDRTYRPAYSHLTAIALLRSEAERGKVDPLLFESFECYIRLAAATRAAGVGRRA